MVSYRFNWFKKYSSLILRKATLQSFCVIAGKISLCETSFIEIRILGYFFVKMAMALGNTIPIKTEEFKIRIWVS